MKRFLRIIFEETTANDILVRAITASAPGFPKIMAAAQAMRASVFGRTVYSIFCTQ